MSSYSKPPTSISNQGPAALLPETMRVFERGWLSSNSVLFQGAGATALVDSGYATHASQTLSLVESTLGARRLDLILTTHLHSDHCGGHARLQRAWGSDVLVPKAEIELVREWREQEFNFALTGQKCERFFCGGALAVGAVLTLGELRWEIVAAPGHDPNAIMLYCASEQILISADALWENGFGVVFPELEGDPGYAQTRRTLESIQGLAIRLVIPGHGAPFTDIDKSLKAAFSRLDYLQADPTRGARHALRVLLKFSLLEHRVLLIADLPRTFAPVPLVSRVNRRFLQLEDEKLCELVVRELVGSGAATVEGAYLVNQDGPRASRTSGKAPP
ncbi:MAG: MBL fold metallo-hydrolase [Burkholderiaceae bacterium]